jgi:16S rRNA (uracil1498-N3)-methyltransferase
MKLHRFFSPEKIDDGVSAMTGTLVTYADASQQWQRVLRFNRGERVVLFDGSGHDFTCEIKDYQGKTVSLEIIEKKENVVKATRGIVLYAALVKKDTFEWIVQKATELGVLDIVPVLADRSEKKNINVERLEKIIVEAAEQSGRGALPKLHEMQSLGDVLSDKDFLGGKAAESIAFDPIGKKFSEEDIKDMSDSDNMGVFIGPEGGWSENELADFEKTGVLVRSLGPQILRTETAVVAALAQLIF